MSGISVPNSRIRAKFPMKISAAAAASKFAMSYQSATVTGEDTLSPVAAVQRSQWRSPVPYLFGGLAAMLGLIAFALLILACSYWKLSGEEGGNEGESEGGAAADDSKETPAAFEEKFLVIMAGEDKPTFLATRKAVTGLSDGKIINNGNENPRLDDQNQIQEMIRMTENGHQKAPNFEKSEDTTKNNDE